MRTSVTCFGVDVHFPFERLYQAQRAMIANSIRAYHNGENALLESPAGTGRSMALVAGALAFQRERKNTAADMCNSSRIWYAMRSPAQMKKVVNDYKQLQYGVQMAVLTERQYMCLNKSVAKASDIDAACQCELQAGKCRYTVVTDVPDEFKSDGVYSKCDIEDMMLYGEQNMICPYYMAQAMMDKAEIVFTDHNSLFSPRLGPTTFRMALDGDLVIVDDGHDIASTCTELASVRMTVAELNTAVSALTRVSPDASQLYLVILNWLNSVTKGLRYARIETFECTMQEALAEWKLNLRSWPVVCCAFEKLLRLRTVRLSMIVRRLFGILTLCFSDNAVHCQSFRIIVTLGQCDQQNTLVCRCLQADVIFRQVASQTRSIIIASDAMCPLKAFGEELRTEFNISLSAPHVVPKEQIATLILTNTPDGTVFNTIPSYFDAHKDDMIVGAGCVLEAFLPVVPGRALLVVPSWSIQRDVTLTWKRTGLWDRLKAIKPIQVIDGQDLVIQQKVSVNQESLIISVAKVDADYTEHSVQIVIVFGMPCPDGSADTSEPHIIRTLHRTMAGCVKRTSDFAGIVLMDSRMPLLVAELPWWIRTTIRDNSGMSDIRQQLAVFFNTMEAQFWKPARWNPQTSMLCKCRACNAKVIDVAKICAEESVRFDRTGFMKLLDTYSLDCICVPRVSHWTMHATIHHENQWMPSDRIAYGIVECPCGIKLGAVVRAARSEDKEFLDGVLILTSRVTIHSRFTSPASSPRKTKPGNHRQTRLSFGSI